MCFVVESTRYNNTKLCFITLTCIVEVCMATCDKVGDEGSHVITHPQCVTVFSYEV